MLLCLRSIGDLKDLSYEEIGNILRISTEQVKSTIEVFIEKGLITEKLKITDWDKVHYLSDLSTDRVKKHRMNRTESITKQAEEIYSAYPRKVGKKKAIDSIKVALKKIPFPDLLEIVKEYRSCNYVATAPAQFIPLPATWFNQERWEDDRTEWNREYQVRNIPKQIKFPEAEQNKAEW